MAENLTQKESAEVRYTKAVIIEDSRFRVYADLLSVILDDKKTYSVEEVDNLLDAELKREVN